MSGDNGVGGDWLVHYPRLDGIDDPVWLQALSHVQEMVVPAGMLLCKPGDPCNGLLFWMEGRVRVFMTAASGREIILHRLERPDVCVFTLIPLLRDASYPLAAMAETDGRAMVLPALHFRRAFAGCCRFRDFILERLACRFHEMLGLVQEVAFERLEARLVCLLSRRFREEGVECIAITHQQIAQELGTTREVVSRMLKVLERRGCVRLHRGRIELGDSGALGIRAEAAPALLGRVRTKRRRSGRS